MRAILVAAMALALWPQTFRVSVDAVRVDVASAALTGGS